MALEAGVRADPPLVYSGETACQGGASVLASPEVCLALRPGQAQSLRVDFAGHLPPAAVRAESLSSAAKAPQAQAALTLQDGMWVLAIVTSAAPHTEVVTLPSLACNLHSTVAWSQGPSWGGLEKNTLASSIMSAKRAEPKKANLVKEKELDPGEPLSPHEWSWGGGGYRDLLMKAGLLFLCLSMK